MIGEKIRSLRNEKGYTQVQMESLIGIDQSDLSKIERGQRKPTFEQLAKFAVAFETSMDFLAGITDEPSPYPLSARGEMMHNEIFDLRDSE